MLTKAHILPGWLYRAWPWLVLAIGIGYGAIGHPIVFAGMTFYAGLLWTYRAANRITK